MSSTDDERPTPRTRPRPARTGGDPARPAPSDPPAAPAPAPAAMPGDVRRAGRAQPLVQLNTRVLPILDDLVALVQDEQGISKR
ncbi:hypothetical protein ACFUC0_24270, partial [Bacillus subtilis]